MAATPPDAQKRKIDWNIDRRVEIGASSRDIKGKVELTLTGDYTEAD